jgi:hypothetical protein
MSYYQNYYRITIKYDYRDIYASREYSLNPSKNLPFWCNDEKIKHALSCLINKINAEVQIKCRSRNIKTDKDCIFAYLFGALMKKMLYLGLLRKSI